ncbi:MAG TPA: sensor histidine kinase [Longilinea sp.]|nr:sensor histidine kinase [Longilinea sp.]
MTTEKPETIEKSQKDPASKVESDLEEARKTLREITMMLDQSQSELSKLVQKNASVDSQLQQVQSQLETMPRQDILKIYNEALNTRQRMLVMRGQLERLQAEQAGLKKYIDIAAVVVTNPLALAPSSSKKGGTSGRSTDAGTNLEMIINAQESERQRLSRQMHDGPAQSLSNFIVQTEIATRLLDIDPSRAKEELNNLKNSAMSTFQKVRAFIADLRPMMLDDLGLIPTLRRYIEVFKEQNGIEAIFNSRGMERKIEPYLEIMIFRAVQELMNNAIHHNADLGNKLQISVQVVIDSESVKVTVGDNGVGLNPDSIAASTGLGLKIIRERVELLGGQLDIDSAPGKGCSITFQIPCLEIKTQTVQS